MKDKIISWIKGPRNYHEGVAIYQQHGYNNVLKKRFAMARNETTEALLFTKMCELAGISEATASRLPRMAVNRKPATAPVVKAYVDDTLIQLMDKLGINTEVLEAGTIPEDISGDETKKTAFTGVQKIYTELPETTRRVIKIREQYLFLRDKDCPDFIKILVHELFTEYDNYRNAYAKLVEAPDNTDQEETFRLATTTVESYLSNRELWDELNHYKENKEILGKHPLFEQYTKEKEVKNLTDLEITNKLFTARSQLSKSKKKLEQATGNEEKIKAANEAIEKWAAAVDLLSKERDARKK